MANLTRAHIQSALFVLFFVFGCSDDSVEPPPEEKPYLNELVIQTSDGDLLDLAGNSITQLSIQGLDQFGDAYELPSDPVWTSNNDNITINADGLVNGLAVGFATITAEIEEVKATIEIQIWDSSVPRIDIYVCDLGVNRTGPPEIIVYRGNDKNFITLINTNLSSPQDIIFLEEEETILISNLGSNNINKFDINNGGFKGSFTTGLSGPTRMAIGPDNLLYVISWNGGPVKRFKLDGTFVDDFTTSINEAIGIAWDKLNNMYVSSFNSGSSGFIKKFDALGADLGVFINTNIQGPTDIWFDSEGNMLVNDWSGNKVEKFNASGNYIGTFISNIGAPEGVDFMDDGTILIGSSSIGAVWRFDNEGNFIEEVVAPEAGGLNTTSAVKVRKVNH